MDIRREGTRARKKRGGREMRDGESGGDKIETERRDG